MPDTAGNSLATATSLNLTSSVQSFNDLVTPAANDYYRFVLSARSSLNLSLTGLDANANVELLNSAGSPVSLGGVPINSTNPGTFSELINTQLDPGIYFVRVSPGSTETLANYTLNISATNNLVSQDLLLRNPSTGATAIWALNGTSFVSSVSLSNSRPSNWTVGGLGDFNRDGKTDILWRDRTAALTDVWFMDGRTSLSSASILPSLGSNWILGGTGDFNKDSNVDIVWRNTTTGAVNVWFLSGTTSLSTATIGTTIGNQWSLGAIGDFNRDGNLDLVWRNNSTGSTVFWLLNSQYQIQTSTALGRAPGTTWTLSGTGDFNRDGNLDLVWRSQSGPISIWLMDRTAYSASASVRSIGLPWTVSSPYTAFGDPRPIDAAGNTRATAFDLGKNLGGSAFYRERVDGTTDPNDFYQFNIASDARVRLSLSDLSADLELGLFDNAGNLVTSSNQAGTGAETITQSLAAGTYFIRVNPFSTSDRSSYLLGVSINTPPILVTNSLLTVSEQGTANLSNAILRVTDADNPPAELVYSVGGLPLSGALLINGVTATLGTTFTQADLDDGSRIRYLHNGSETTSDRFTFSVSDNSGGAIGLTTFSIAVTPVNDPPLLVSNLGLTVSEGTQASITQALLQFTDVDSPTAGLVYSVTTLPVNGTLLLSGTAVTSFTQADLLSGNLQYLHNGSETTSDRFTFTVADGAGGLVTSTFTINVTPVNDPPVLSTNFGLTVSEGEANSILPGLLQVTDPDSPPASITYSVTSLPAHGTLLLLGTAVTSFTQADVISGNLRYQHNGSETVSDRFVFTITDGAIPSPLGPNTFTINVTPVNDPPVVATNIGLTLSEGTSAFITPNRLNATDPEGQTPVTYTLDSLPTNGILRRGTQTLSVGQTFTQADITSNQLAYLHNDTETTTDSFRFSVSDATGAIAQPSTFSITILAVNDAPVLTLPTGTQVIDQETNTLLAGIRVTDVDLGTGEVTVTLSTGNGVLSLGRTTGITFLTGDGTQDEVLSFRGTQDITNFVLQSLIYRSDNNFIGSDTINVSVSDGGNSGLGGALTTSGTLSLRIAGVNDAPILTVPGAQTVREDTTASIPGISIADPDAANSVVRVSLSAANGNLFLSSTAGITITAGSNGDKTFVFEGILGEVNRVLSGLSYRGDRDFNGSDLITISVSDTLNGNNGIPLSDSDTIAITVTAQNDAPVITVPGAQTTNENADLRITGIRIDDVDATGDLTVNMSTSSGRLSLNSTGGLTFEDGDGTQDGTLVFSGTQEAVNTALRTLIYRANTDFNGNDTISINVSDGGSTGFGGILGDSEAIAVTVRGVNNAPAITVPTTNLAVDSDTNLTITGISISDPDAAGGDLSVTLLASNGTLSLNNTTGLSFNQGDGNQDNRISFRGSLVAINNALSSLTYRSYPGFTNAFDRIDVSVNDNGNSGIGVSLSDTEVLFVSVGGAVNLAPIAINDSFSVAEEGTLISSSILANDSDPDFTVPLSAVLVAGPANALSFALNANGSFTYTPTANFSGTDTFTYQATDALGGSSNTATVVITVSGVNDNPIAVNDSFTTPEDQPITNGAVLTNDTDPDNTIPLTAQLIAGPTNATSFTLNGDGTFNYTPRPDFTGGDRFTYVVVDALGGTSNTATVSITVTTVNDAPLARNDGPFSLPAGGTLAITGAGVLSNDTDVDTTLASLTAILVSQATNGTVSLNPNGSFTYQPTGSFAGVDTFTYQASDGITTSNLATVTLSVGANSAPIASPNSFTLGEDGTLTIGNVLTNDVDPEGNTPLTATLAVAPANALSFTLNPDGTFSYQPNANFNGVDTFVYQAIDSLGAISNPTTVTFNVSAVNDAPTAVNDTLSVSPGATLNITAPGILANDTDIDGPALSAVLVGTTANGTLTLNPNGSFTYRPNAGFQGTDSFTYRANDGSLSSANTATVFLSVTTAANLLPTAAPDTFTVSEDTSLTLGNVLTNDTDPEGTPLTATLVGAAPANALSFTLRPDGTFSYQPNANFVGIDTFTYSAIDSVGGTSAPTTVTFSVTPVNDAPTALNDNYSVATTATLNITAPGILANDTDVDSTALTATLVANAANGTLSLNPDGSFIYRPNAGFSGVDSFTYQATDGTLTSANTATVNITVAAVVNTAPTAVADTFSAIEDTLLTTGNVLANDTDPDGNIPLTASLGVGPTNALSFTLNADGSFNYLPQANFNGTDTFTYVAVDSLGGRSQTATVTFNVAAVNDLPIAGNNNYNVAPAGTLNITLPGVLANDTDADGTALTASLVGATPAGALSFTLNPDGSFLYIPQATFAGTDTFTYQASDGTTVSNLATVSIVVTSNLFPTANPDTFTTQEDTSLTIGNVLTNDTDPDGNVPLTASLGVGPANALSFTLNPNGSFNYQPNLNFSGIDTFTYTASDALGGLSNPTTVTFSVTPVNDLPLVTNDSVVVNGGVASTITAPGVLANDTDPDGNPLTASLVTNGSNGTATLNPNGSFVYTPNTGFVGLDSFTYLASDGTGNSAPATVTVRVNAPPTAANDTYTAVIGGSFNVDNLNGVLTNDADPDGGDLSATLVTGPTQGTVTLNPDGSFVYNPNGSATGTDSFVYRATDGLASATATVTIALRTNTAPVAFNDTFRAASNNTLVVASTDSILGNDTDVDAGTALTATLVSTTPQGTLSLNPDGTFTYAPQAGFQGVDSFVYRASDGITVSGPATVTLSVSNNTPPVAGNDTYTAFSGVPFTQNPPGVSSNDSDANGDSLTIFLVSGPVNGTVTLELDGEFTYIANPTFQGTDTFVYRAFDGFDSSTATVTMSVTQNLPPVANPDVFGAIAGQTLVVTAPGVLANDSDPEGTLAALSGGSLPTNGQLLNFNSNGSFSYLPNPGFTGTDFFTYEASDGVSEVLTTVTISVAANAAPVANSDTYRVNPGNQLIVSQTLGVLANDTDPNLGQALSASVVTNPTRGALSLNPNGSFTYTPTGTAAGTDSFTYRATDGSLNSTAVVTITINATSTPPTAQNDGGFTIPTNGTLTVAAAAGVLANDTDTDGDLLRSTVVTNAGNGTVTLNADGSFVYRPNTNFQGTDSFTYRALDGLTTSTPATAFITVGGVNAAPVIVSPGNQLIQQNTTLNLASNLRVTDIDAGSNPVSVTLAATNGTLTLGSLTGLTFTTGDGTGDASMVFTGSIANLNTALTNLQFIPTTGFTGAAQITLAVNDQGASGTGGAQTGTGTVSINVASGAGLVTDIQLGGVGSNPINLVNTGGNTVYFAASDGTTGTELWRSDGTGAGTTRVADINLGTAASSPANLTVVGNTLYYTAITAATERELWRTDLTTGTGSTLVSDIRPGTDSSSPQNLTNYANTLFFVATEGVGGVRQLWRVDASGNPVKVSTTLTNVGNLTVAGNSLYFTVSNGSQLWKVDSATGAPALVSNIGTSASISNLTAVGDRLFFAARDGAGVELWSSDGTAANTSRVADLNTGTGDSSPNNLVSFNGNLYFFARDNATGPFKLFRSTPTGVVSEVATLPSGGASPGRLTISGNRLFFVVDAGTGASPSLQLWSSDGGSSAGVVRDLNAGNDDVSALTNFNGTLFFVANDGTGYKIFRSDGTSGNTIAVSGTFTTPPTNLTVAGDQLLFNASNTANGSELWSIG